MHFLNFKSTKQVIPTLFIDSTDEVRIWVAHISWHTAIKAQDGRQEDFQMSHNDTLSIVLNLIFIAVIILELQLLWWALHWL